LAGQGMAGMAPDTGVVAGRARCIDRAGKGRPSWTAIAVTARTSTTNATQGHRRRLRTAGATGGASKGGASDTGGDSATGTVRDTGGNTGAGGDTATDVDSGAASRMAETVPPDMLPGATVVPFRPSPGTVPDAPSPVVTAGSSPARVSTEPTSLSGPEAAPRTCRPRCRTTGLPVGELLELFGGHEHGAGLRTF
jgi:hypothetical protein